MKDNYFTQERADGDDDLLRAAVEQGVVPASCLNGGVLVTEFHNAGEDPCAWCAGPRDRCGGRPANPDLDAGVQAAASVLNAVGTREAKARKLLRKSQIDSLLAMAHGPPEGIEDNTDASIRKGESDGS